MKSILLSLILLILVAVLLACSGKRPNAIGVVNGSLTPCPKKPNCVSSMTKDQDHFIDPYTYSGTKQQAFEALLRVLKDQARAVVIEQQDDYLHAEFKSKYFRFVDDVEFYFPKEEALIHIRSASRLGHSDLGVNKKRMESIRAKLAEELIKK